MCSSLHEAKPGDWGAVRTAIRRTANFEHEVIRVLHTRRTFLKGMSAATLAGSVLDLLLRAEAAAVGNPEQRMEIKRVGSQPSTNGPADWFTGKVRIDPLFQASAPARVRGASVTFEPGARTAWHTHPLGQTLIVIAGLGLAQRWDGPIKEIRPGDVVWFPPGVKHWHGASTTTAMTHIAIHEQLDGKAVDWLEHVSNEQYRARSK
jgi:quercetin dioxygenase-like cupin family protein